MKKTVKKDEVVMYGAVEGAQACGNCISLDKELKGLTNTEIPIEYNHYSVYTDEIGKKVASEKNIEEIPYVEHCKVADDDTKKCDVVVGYNKKDWENVGKKREEEF